MNVTTLIPFNGDTVTPTACARLEGGQVQMTAGLDRSRPLGRATVVEAKMAGGSLRLVLDYDDMSAGRIAREWPDIDPDDLWAVGNCGYLIRSAVTDTEGHREFQHIVLLEVSPWLNSEEATRG